MATQTAFLSLDEFHLRYDGRKPAFEYWNGEAVQKTMPTMLHGIVQFLLMKLLTEAGWVAASEVRLMAVPNYEPVPDVIGLPHKAKGRYPESAPDLCIEILSPDDTQAKVFQKSVHYVRWGSLHVWVIDPERRVAWEAAKDDQDEVLWIERGGTLQFGANVLRLADLWAAVDQMFEG